MKRAMLERSVAERISIAMQVVQGCERCLQPHIDPARGLRIDEDEIELARRGNVVGSPLCRDDRVRSSGLSRAHHDY